MKVTLSLSGGLNSATLLALACRNHTVNAVNFRYGSKHNALEAAAAKQLADHFGVPLTVVDLSEAFAPLSSDLLLTGGKVPVGHYEAESMRRTVVPCRNLIFASVLIAAAASRGDDQVWLGVHAGDHFIYPDCRPEFVRRLCDLGYVAHESPVVVTAPFLHHDKGYVVQLARALGVPFTKTRTCYTSDPVACGRCGACQERLQAFLNNGDEDPLEYQSRSVFPKEPRDA